MYSPTPLTKERETLQTVSGAGIAVNRDLLERTCKNTIETILFCLEYVTKGTIYIVGALPDLQVVRVTSGIREGETIRWGLPDHSDYNFPGKAWENYRDAPGRVLEAVGWCVERQESWTVNNPLQDVRSVRRQVFGEVEDFFHLEPVLVKKTELFGTKGTDLPLPSNSQGEPIWQGTDYVVVALIKIHFQPETIRTGDRSTKIIQRLSRTLGTELISLQLRETYLRSQEKLARQRLRTVNALAHELRNTLTKMGLVFSLINNVVSCLREQWEVEFEKVGPPYESRVAVLSRLDALLLSGRSRLPGQDRLTQTADRLAAEQKHMSEEFPLPMHLEGWIRNKIRPKWERLASASPFFQERKEEIHALLERLESSTQAVLDESLADKLEHIPGEVRSLWMKNAYIRFSANNFAALDELLLLLDHPTVKVPRKQRIKRMLSSLKILAQVISNMEERANRMLLSLKEAPPD